MILYHGTNEDFGDIDLAKSKPNKDFGQGFYLSREYTISATCAASPSNTSSVLSVP
jgi:hypothetical protein